jgi:hypothetical protein
MDDQKLCFLVRCTLIKIAGSELQLFNEFA